MEIHVRLHGILRDGLPEEAKGAEILTLCEDARVADVIAWLERIGGRTAYVIAVRWKRARGLRPSRGRW